MQRGLIFLTMCVLVPSSALAGIQGTYRSSLGTLKLKQKGAEVHATLVKPTKGCALKKSQNVLTGVMLEDNLTGELTVCQVGEGCAPTTKAFVILLVSKKGSLLTGALHLPDPKCQVPGMGTKRGLRISRNAYVKPKPKPRPDPKQTESEWVQPGAQVPVDPDAGKGVDDLLREGFELLARGTVEDARAKFIRASEVDPSRAEPFNGVGVTFWARQKYTDALLWYKKALETNPDFGDSFYNMACIYSLENKRELALKYLRIALLNNYISKNDVGQILEDPDFQNIRGDPEFVELIRSVAPDAEIPGSKASPVSTTQPAQGLGMTASGTAAHGSTPAPTTP
ncbi:MAG: tetratricopeptide repeat protein [Pseudomonadota bacterium]